MRIYNKEKDPRAATQGSEHNRPERNALGEKEASKGSKSRNAGGRNNKFEVSV